MGCRESALESVERLSNLSFYRGKRIFVTGHTGFKGSWLCQILLDAGAEVTGYSLAPKTASNLFSQTGLATQMHSIIGDVRDFASLQKAFDDAKPEIVLHLAAQPIVRESYRDPVGTYATNVMGTVHVLECVRQSDTVRSVLNVTTDKVYQNKEWTWGYREIDPLDGYDPYSNSKSCSELVTHSYKNSFFADGTVAISTARAGNVIGGGDDAADRIIPDCIRAVIAGRPIVLRNPKSIRPYQHVLEPLFAYLLIAERQYENAALADWYNVGPDTCDCVTTEALAAMFCRAWGGNAHTKTHSDGGPHEANFLKLDCSKIRQVLGWHPTWHIDEAVRQTVEFAHWQQAGLNVAEEMQREIRVFMAKYNDENEGVKEHMQKMSIRGGAETEVTRQDVHFICTLTISYRFFLKNLLMQRYRRLGVFRRCEKAACA